MSPVVPVDRKLNIWNTKLKMDVFGPSAARLSVLARPTHAVSMRDMSGSARSDPKAGSASANISCVSLAFQNLWTGNGGLTLGPLDNISPLFLSFRSTGTVPSSFPPPSSLLEGTILAHRTGHVRLPLVLGHLFHVRGVAVVRRALPSIAAILRELRRFRGGSFHSLCASRFSCPPLPAKTEGKTKGCSPKVSRSTDRSRWIDGWSRWSRTRPERNIDQHRILSRFRTVGGKGPLPPPATLHHSLGFVRHREGTSCEDGAGWSSPHPITCTALLPVCVCVGGGDHRWSEAGPSTDADEERTVEIGGGEPSQVGMEWNEKRKKTDPRGSRGRSRCYRGGRS